MPAVNTPICEFGWQAKDFSLQSPDNEIIALITARGNKGTLIMFICNHCPYVVSTLDEIIFEANELIKNEIAVIAISSNDASTHPEDSFEKMKQLSINKNLPFSYLNDETQEEITEDYKGAPDLEIGTWNTADNYEVHVIANDPRNLDFEYDVFYYEPSFHEVIDRIKQLDSDATVYVSDFETYLPETKLSKYTKKYRQMYGEEFVMEEIKGISNKAKKSGMPYSILKKVYDRGMAAWKGGHRPGTTQQQWAFARINSFITKSPGTWGKADSDLAKKVRGQ